MRHMIIVAAAILSAAGAVRAAVAAQASGYQPPASQATPLLTEQATRACALAQAQASRTIDQAAARLEAARQSNSPAAMRAAMDDLEAALRDLRAQLAPCAALQAASAGDPHAGHATPTAPRAPAVSPVPLATPPVQSSKVDPSKAEPPKPATTHPGEHSKMEKAEPRLPVIPVERQVVDPVCATKVDRETAPKATYRGQTYYFCSEADKAKFLKNPVAYTKKPPP